MFNAGLCLWLRTTQSFIPLAPPISLVNKVFDSILSTRTLTVLSLSPIFFPLLFRFNGHRWLDLLWGIEYQYAEWAEYVPVVAFRWQTSDQLRRQDILPLYQE